eukprot:CAMPEP_0194268120 /NCGR_PEP_ID=MMETSP0169-20130528/2500_1 /TAXON_ID=218684 /ORGANISM="Corethron pennatum, Strain L29A3" /LENGTH=455 /DNA_ID=CAMNT_0039009221 /DNA_START=95 /DNA_END=1462 /DNA_ORIENTATION=-
MTSASPIWANGTGTRSRSRHQQLIQPKTYHPSQILNTSEAHEHDDRDQIGDARPNNDLFRKEGLEHRNLEKRQDGSERDLASPEEDALLGSKILNCAKEPKIVNRAVFVINALVLIGAVAISPSGINIGAPGDNANYIQLIPIAGIVIFMGIISGYIPSPLYNRNERWPREYAIAQLVLLIMTASRLTRHIDNYEEGEELDEEEDEESYDYDYDIKELASFTSWLGSSLFKLFFKDNYNHFIENFTNELVRFSLVVAASYIVARIDWLKKIDETKNLPLVLVFFRNFFLHVVISIWFIWEDLIDSDGGQLKECRNEHNIEPGFIAPDYPLSQMASEFAAGWKVFHLSDLWLVRLSHAILYPSILLLYTRRPLTLFFIWVMFIEIDFFHMLADMIHYVSGPALAEKRFDFQSHPTDCYVNVQLLQTLLAYPLNFLYLTTSFGDTPPTNIADITTGE